jgi:hypothetical protein
MRGVSARSLCFSLFRHFVFGQGFFCGSFCGSSSLLSFLPCFSTLPSALPFLLRYATLAASSSGFFFYSPDDSRRRGGFLFVFLLATSPTYGSSPPATSSGTPSAVHRCYAPCAHGHIGDLTSYLPGVWVGVYSLWWLFFSSRGRGGSSESEMWGSRLRSRRYVGFRRFRLFSVFFFFFFEGNLDFRVLLEIYSVVGFLGSPL